MHASRVMAALLFMMITAELCWTSTNIKKKKMFLNHFPSVIYFRGHTQFQTSEAEPGFLEESVCLDHEILPFPCLACTLSSAWSSPPGVSRQSPSSCPVCITSNWSTHETHLKWKKTQTNYSRSNSKDFHSKRVKFISHWVLQISLKN